MEISRRKLASKKRENEKKFYKNERGRNLLFARHRGAWLAPEQSEGKNFQIKKKLSNKISCYQRNQSGSDASRGARRKKKNF